MFSNKKNSLITNQGLLYCKKKKIAFLAEVTFKIGDPHVFRHSGIKLAKGFSIINNLTVTTYATLTYIRGNFQRLLIL